MTECPDELERRLRALVDDQYTDEEIAEHGLDWLVRTAALLGAAMAYEECAQLLESEAAGAVEEDVALIRAHAAAKQSASRPEGKP